jgi:hypothetical protein
MHLDELFENRVNGKIGMLISINREDGIGDSEPTYNLEIGGDGYPVRNTSEVAEMLKWYIENKV